MRARLDYAGLPTTGSVEYQREALALVNDQRNLAPARANSAPSIHIAEERPTTIVACSTLSMVTTKWMMPGRVSAHTFH